MLLKRHFWVINLALISLFVWASADLFLAYVSAKLDQRPLPRLGAPAAPPGEPEKRPKGYFTMMTGHNIFDPYGEGYVPKPVVSETAYVPPPPPPLSSKLRLKGTVAGEPGFGWAIVDDLDQRRQEVVKVGGRLRNAQLVSVTRDKAVFEMEGRQETLALLEKDIAAPASPGSAARRPAGRPLPTPQFPGPAGAPAANRPTAVYRPGGPTEGELFQTLGPSRMAVDRQGLNKLAAEPDRLGTEAKLVAQNGGLQVNDVSPGGLAERAGLRSGDVVKRINGSPVSTPIEALQAYQRAQGGPSLRVEVERNRRPLTLTYEMR